MSETKTINVAAAIFYRDNKILAACRADKENTGFWEFPGGKVEAGETSEQALRREIQEELHCSVQAAFFYDTVLERYLCVTASIETADCLHTTHTCNLAKGYR